MRNNEFGIDNALWQRAMQEDQSEEDFQQVLKEQAVINDITGSLGVWGIKAQ